MTIETTENRIAIPRSSITQLHVAVANWNGMHPVGTPVEVLKDDGSIVETTTTSEAWIMGGHSAVIKVAGIAGGYALTRVKAITGRKS